MVTWPMQALLGCMATIKGQQWETCVEPFLKVTQKEEDPDDAAAEAVDDDGGGELGLRSC